MDKLYDEFCPYDKYSALLKEPFNADANCRVKTNYFNTHIQKCYIIKNNKIKPVDATLNIKRMIESIYFLYVDFGEEKWDDKYWFVVGKLNEGVKEFYFVYESGCCGSGFIGSESKLYVAQTKEVLSEYGFTNKQRELINTNLNSNRRYTCPDKIM